jgi:hypothetical protein
MVAPHGVAGLECYEHFLSWSHHPEEGEEHAKQVGTSHLYVQACKSSYSWQSRALLVVSSTATSNQRSRYLNHHCWPPLTAGLLV